VNLLAFSLSKDFFYRARVARISLISIPHPADKPLERSLGAPRCRTCAIVSPEFITRRS